MSNKLYYLASPYSHTSQYVKNRRHLEIDYIGGLLTLNDYFIVGPISMNAPWANLHSDISGMWDFWEKFDKILIDRCDGLLVATMEGWKESVGVQAEIKYAKSLGKSILYLDANKALTEDKIEITEE